MSTNANSIAENARKHLLKAAWEEGLSRSEQQREYKEAERGFGEALRQDPECYVALIGIGQIRAKRDYLYDEAIAFYDQAIANDANNPEGWLLKSLSLSDKGNRSEAIDCIDTAIKLSNDPHGVSMLKQVRSSILE